MFNSVMKKISLCIFALSLFLISGHSSLASRPSFDVNGKCDIKGVINLVNFEEGYKDSCEKDNSCPVSAFVSGKSAQYRLEIRIVSLSCEASEPWNPETSGCDQTIRLGNRSWTRRR